MIIDIHAHFPRNEPDFANRLVDHLPVAGIEKIVMFAAGDALAFAPNATILAAARQFPEKIIAFAFVDLGKDSPECIERYAAEGYRGFKIINPSAAYDDELFFPVYERMEKTGLPLLAHTGIVSRFSKPPHMRVNSNWMRPICLDMVLRQFPALNIIGAHMGAPWHEEASMMARIHPNFYLDLTGAWWGGWRVNKGPEFYRYHFFWEGAWNKVLFGTDILELRELIPAKQIHDQLIEKLSLPPDIVANIYGGTAARLMKL